MSAILSIGKKIVSRLFDKGYIAYFAGGWVRDLLLGLSSDEIDIATSAPPEIVMTLFEKAIPVGVHFGVVIVVLEGKEFEITTFRKDHPYIDGRHPQGVDYSTPEKDAHRRDFTINGMFYDPLTETLIDYVGGEKDLKDKIIRSIGDPFARFEEDKLRLMRAIRFCFRFGFTIEQETEKAIYALSSKLLPAVSMERIWQELTKMSRYPHFDKALITMHRLGLLATIFKELKACPLNEIKKRVAPFPYFPFLCPTIVFILELFPTLTLEERFGLCVYLKTTRKDMKLVQFFYESQILFVKPDSLPHEWVHFYAHPHSHLFLEIEKAKKEPQEKNDFQHFHEERQKKWHFHIKNIQNKTPLITSSLLMKEGVIPGVKMGLLLKEAEKIAIDNDLHDKKKVLALLKDTILWST